MSDHLKYPLLIGIFMIWECGSALILPGTNETVQGARKINAIEKALTQVRYLPHLLYGSLRKAAVEVTLISPKAETQHGQNYLPGRYCGIQNASFYSPCIS